MSGDEVLFLIVHGIVGLLAWAGWYGWILEIKHFGRPVPGKNALLFTPVFCLVLTVAGLQLYADPFVRGTFYLAWYAVMWLAWVGVAVTWLCPLLGLRYLDDAIERRNPAATIAVLGAMLGLTLAFLGGNFGEGPSWAVVALCTVLSFGGLFCLWLLLAVFSPIVQRITVERDLAAAVRAAGLLVGCGAVLGRAVAGDWVDIPGTFRDFFAIGWVLPLLVLIELAVSPLAPIARRFGPGVLFFGMAPACLYTGLSAAYVVEVGWW